MGKGAFRKIGEQPLESPKGFFCFTLRKKYLSFPEENTVLRLALGKD
jgi:hypothetical protein